MKLITDLDKTVRGIRVHLLVVVVCLQMVTGCAPTINIYNDGFPAARESELTWSSDGKMFARWVLARLHPVTIVSGKYSELVDYPEYLSADELNSLASDTSAVMTRLDIYNPNGQRYQVVKVVDIGGVRSQEPVSGWTIRPYQALNISNPLVRNREIKVSLVVLSGDEGESGSPLMTTAEMRYIIN